jgi:hypothetical protein
MVQNVQLVHSQPISIHHNIHVSIVLLVKPIIQPLNNVNVHKVNFLLDLIVSYVIILIILILIKKNV